MDILCFGSHWKIELDIWLFEITKHTTSTMIGTHIRKSGSFTKSLQAFFSSENVGRPVQIFSGSPKFWKRPKVTPEQQKEVLDYITEHKHQVFVHSIYLINLSWDPTSFEQKALPCIQWELRNGKAMGFKGVVVHCGKSCKLSLEEAQTNMLINIRRAMEAASPECPLLLETSSGQGTEMCWAFDSFKKFYANFTEEEKTRLRICIDTCHVFAAGHDPLKFIQDWEEAFSNTLVLVHFNDSVECCGCKKDRHERPGKGKIGLEKMTSIAKWCMEREIPLVME